MTKVVWLLLQLLLLVVHSVSCGPVGEQEPATSLLGEVGRVASAMESLVRLGDRLLEGKVARLEARLGELQAGLNNSR